MDAHAPITDPTDPHFGCDPTTIVVYEDGSSICDAPGADADYYEAAVDVPAAPALLPDTALASGDVPGGLLAVSLLLAALVSTVTKIVRHTK